MRCAPSNAEMDPVGIRQATVTTATRFADPKGSGLLAAVEQAGFRSVELRSVVDVTFKLPQNWWEVLLELPVPLKPTVGLPLQLPACCPILPCSERGAVPPSCPQQLDKQVQAGNTEAYAQGKARLEELLRANGILQPDGTLFSASGNACWFLVARS